MEDNLSSDASYSYVYDLSDAFKHPIQIEIFISLFVWFISLSALTGNILVFVSFARDAELRAKVGNLFLLNLASADLMVGINSLTFNNLWRYYGNWPFGEQLCKMCLLFDYAATLQSTFAITLISFDRYLMVTMELRYRTFMDHWKASSLIGMTWFSSLMFFAVPILGYDHWETGSWVNYSVTCDVAVIYILSYNIVTIFFAFVIPGCLLMFFNMMVFLNIRKRSSGLVRSRQVAPSEPTISTVADPLREYTRTTTSSTIQSVSGRDGATKATISSKSQSVSGRDGATKATISSKSQSVSGRDGATKATISSKSQSVSGRDGEAQEEVAQQHRARDQKRVLKRDKKTAATLGMIVTTYVICWLPYYITQLIYVAYKKEYYISWRIWMAVYYLIWLNSALNPCLYAIASPRIRRNLYELLFFWKKFCKL